MLHGMSSWICYVCVVCRHIVMNPGDSVVKKTSNIPGTPVISWQDSWFPPFCEFSASLPHTVTRWSCSCFGEVPQMYVQSSIACAWVYGFTCSGAYMAVNQRPLAYQIYGSVQGCSNSSALAMELLQSCTKPSKYIWLKAKLMAQCKTAVTPSLKLHFISSGVTTVLH